MRIMFDGQLQYIGAALHQFIYILDGFAGQRRPIHF